MSTGKNFNVATQRAARRERAGRADRARGRIRIQRDRNWGRNHWGRKGDKHKLRFLLPASEVHVEKATTATKTTKTTTTPTCCAANSSRKILVQCNNTPTRKRYQKTRYKNKNKTTTKTSTSCGYTTFIYPLARVSSVYLLELFLKSILFSLFNLKRTFYH